ncbi:MAG: hypothetical protein ABS938_01445 [Psychrobacillus psychrodurans]
MFKEIGSEFWLDNTHEESKSGLPNWLTKYGDVVLTTSGRGAISLILQQLAPINKSVLLPAYICDSVILPFIEHGYTCHFYEVDKRLLPKVELKSFENVGVFLHMGYFGFSTNSDLLNAIQYFKKKSTIIIEDVTHTLFSRFNKYEENDFYVGSIRKWFGVPSGGFLASSKRIVKRPVLTNDDFSMLRTVALNIKGKYMKVNDDSLKNLFLGYFSDAEILLDKDINPYCIDAFSTKLISSLDVNLLISRRRENFKTLLQGIESISYLETPFIHLPINGCPLFYPVMVKTNRDDLRKKLIDEGIYCPIHWPIPEQIRETNLCSTLEIYSDILSIPCDQRYGIAEMERIVSILKNL